MVCALTFKNNSQQDNSNVKGVNYLYANSMALNINTYESLGKKWDVLPIMVRSRSSDRKWVPLSGRLQWSFCLIPVVLAKTMQLCLKSHTFKEPVLHDFVMTWTPEVSNKILHLSPGLSWDTTGKFLPPLENTSQYLDPDYMGNWARHYLKKRLAIFHQLGL